MADNTGAAIRHASVVPPTSLVANPLEVSPNSEKEYEIVEFLINEAKEKEEHPSSIHYI